jgi:hypothetical protein
VKYGKILELRVDIDRRRPQNRISGDFFTKFLIFIFPFGHFPITFYNNSFVVENLNVNQSTNEVVITGPVKYYNDSTNVNDTIEVRIPRVMLLSPPADAIVKFYTAGSLTSTYLCPKISEFFRSVILEIDRFQGTIYPPTASTCVNPHPADLTCENMTTQLIYQRAGIDMTVNEDDVLNDPDSADPGSDWDWGELHDLMEDRFDLFINTLHWNTYGVVVPWFEDHGVSGIMFDWAGGQPGDTRFRQGAAVSHDAIMSKTSGTLYNTTAKQNRLFLWTFAHEIGHAFNLPHTWLRNLTADSASESFMNYPRKYTGGSGTTSHQRRTDYWSNFRWEFDDVELIWMRHADRNSVIFGGINWIWNNLSTFTDPEIEFRNSPLSLEVRAREVFDYGQPVQVELKLKNISNSPQTVDDLLEPEDGLVALYVTRPDGLSVRYFPPMQRIRESRIVTLEPGEALYETMMLSYSASGPLFQKSGEYRIRAYYIVPDMSFVVSPNLRLRVATPKNNSTEELAHLLFSHAAAKFMYFGGTERYPEVTKRLQEAVKMYAKTDPAVVRNIHAALGRHESHDFKHVIQKEDRRVITFRKANLKEAVNHLDAARELLPTKISALDNITYNRLSKLSAECYQRQNQPDEAMRVLKESYQYLQQRKVVKSVLDDYQKRINETTK